MEKFICPICGKEVELATNEEFDGLSFEDDLDKVGCPNCHCFTQGRTIWNFTNTFVNVKLKISKLVSHGMIEDKLLSYVKRVKDLGKVMCDFSVMLSFFPKDDQPNDEGGTKSIFFTVGIINRFFIY